MLERTTRDAVASIKNVDFRAYAQKYVDIEDEFFSHMASFGVPFDERESAVPDCARLQSQGVHVDNDRKSFWLNWISPACLTCREDERTETFLSSTQCPHRCYFCFNPNQADYEYYLDHVHDMAAELKERHDAGMRYVDLALTGGEPLMHKAQTYAFFEQAQRLYPNAYTRLYTSGAYLDEACLETLVELGLNEIRFSVKMDAGDAAVEQTLARIALSKRFIETVMVEMPVMPDEVEQMEALLVELDSIGIAGINLLELCFPYNNAEEFVKRGYRIKNRPYRVVYDYWYAGGAPIAGSERTCLELLEFAAREKLSMGVHYCSLENKFTAQVLRQNDPYRETFHWCALSSRDHFFKSAKVFGEDVGKVRRFFQENHMSVYAEDSFSGIRTLEFPLAYLKRMKRSSHLRHVEVGVSFYVVDKRGGEAMLRELRVDRTTPGLFDEKLDV